MAFCIGGAGHAQRKGLAAATKGTHGKARQRRGKVKAKHGRVQPLGQVTGYPSGGGTQFHNRARNLSGKGKASRR